MLRQLLTLLAVISGFTLAAEPVSAANADLVSIAAAEQCDCAAIPSAPAEFRQSKVMRGLLKARHGAPVPAIAPAPSVRIQVDRARE